MPGKRLIAACATASAVAPPTAAAAATDGPLAIAAGDSIFLQPLGGAETTRVTNAGANVLAASRDGSLLAYSSGRSDVKIVKVSGGGVRTVRLRGLAVNSLDISPDRKRLAITAFRTQDNTPGHIFAYTVRIDGSKLTSLRTKLRFARDLRFRPDGRALLYVGSTGRATEASDCTASIRRIRLDGTGDSQVYLGSGGSRPCPLDLSLSPGGKSVTMTAITSGNEPAGPGPPPGVWRLSLAKGAKAKLLVDQASNPAWSPSGRRIAYNAVKATPTTPGSATGGTFRISPNGGASALVSPRVAAALVWLRGSA